MTEETEDCVHPTFHEVYHYGRKFLVCNQCGIEWEI